jgi:arylformamidase
MRWIDLSRPLHIGMPVWPGDTPFSLQFSAQLAKGDSVNVGALHLSTHTGTHVDAPLHFIDNAADISSLNPERFIGPAYVLACDNVTIIEPAHLRAVPMGTRRLLIRTAAWQHPQQFPHRIPLLSQASVIRLAELGVQLLGIDVPSVDDLDSTQLPIHRALHAHGICILESLDLTHAPAGEGFLVALPLPINGGDASPVRALLGVAEETGRTANGSAGPA